jgi:hypothetical protein
MGKTVNKNLIKSMDTKNIFEKIKKFWIEMDRESKILILLIGICVIILLVFLFSLVGGKGGKVIPPSAPSGERPPFP